MVLPVPLYQLQCGANSYDWGKIGDNSAVARYAAAIEQADFTIESNKPYAELWMGTHPSNPSKDVATGRSLLEMVSENQALMTPEITERYGQKLPFLFKVLSIQKALSIQAHPDKKLAEKLHSQDPKNYPDDNHKPEMTIAITDFDGFCGFRPLAQIVSFLKNVPALRSVVGEDAAKRFVSTVEGKETASDESTVSSNKAAFKDLFQALMTSDESKVASVSKELVKSAQDSPSDFGGSEFGGQEFAELIVRLNSQFPEDIGIFCALFLNYVKLKPGEAMFLQANEPHAYLSGDVIECMAASDNVVRAGFTPKFKDVDNLVQMLTYSYAPIEDQKMKPVPYKGGSNSSSGSPTSLLYDPPIEEFAVIRTELKAGQSETFGAIEGPSIVIITEGSGVVSVGPKKQKATTGYVYFVGATATFTMEADDGMIGFRAFCELKNNQPSARI